MNDPTSPFKAVALKLCVLCLLMRHGRAEFQAAGLSAGSVLEPHAQAASGLIKW